MFENLFADVDTIARHRDGPLFDERHRYLLHCASVGATLHTQRNRARALLRLAMSLPADVHGQVDAELLRHLISKHQPPVADQTAAGLLNIGRPWLKFIGWWHQPEQPIAFPEVLERFVVWMRDERGLTPCTVEQWRYRTANFLRWCKEAGRDLKSLEPEDIDAYFVTYGAQRWSRISAGHIARMLRVFFKHAASTGACSKRLAGSILCHRRYRLETLPYALGWHDVQRLINTATGSTEVDVRDRAILLLLAIYGLRRGEVAALRLEDIDRERGHIRVWRLKRHQPQIYPLVSSVEQALTLYIETARPSVAQAQVFIRTRSPRVPISAPGIYDVVNRRLRSLGVQAAHLGPHALRHACASKMLADGLTLKEIGDHLGHRSAASTSIYAKVDLAGLRQVGEFDLGGPAMKTSELIKDYLAAKRAHGTRLRSGERALYQFARETGDRPLAAVTPQSVATFLRGRGDLSATWTTRYQLLAGLYRFALARGHVSASALPDQRPALPPSITPYVYSQAELKRLLDATDVLESPCSRMQAPTYRALILTLYGSGLRVGEAVRLNLSDVDLAERVLTVHETKFYKSRLVPLGEQLAAALAAYLKRRCCVAMPQGSNSAFFASREGRRLNYPRVVTLFQRVRAHAGIGCPPGASRPPRLHDLRHTAAVHRVLTWYQQGHDVQQLLPKLATYLGHVSVASTQRYLQMTPELLQAASMRFAAYAASVEDEVAEHA